jgi:hypothetical protein
MPKIDVLHIRRLTGTLVRVAQGVVSIACNAIVGRIATRKAWIFTGYYL